MASFAQQKQLVRNYYAQLEQCTVDQVPAVLSQFTAPDYGFEGVYPFMMQQGVDAVSQVFWQPLKRALHTMQRRQDIFMAGTATDGRVWVTSMGQFMGLFDEPYLCVSPTYKMQHLQYVEFCCVADGKITQSAIFVDLLGFMKEAGCYPLPPETGHYFVYPGPCDHNGLLFEDAPAEKSAQTFAIVNRMLTRIIGTADEVQTTEQAAQGLRLDWNEDMIWYGPCGIGASYTISRYQLQHRAPFRNCLDARSTNDIHAYFAEGDFACFYTSMNATPTGGWLGMSGSNKPTLLHGDLDIYYCKDGKISENWCLIDLPYFLHKQGLEIFERTNSILHPQL